MVGMFKDNFGIIWEENFFLRVSELMTSFVVILFEIIIVIKRKAKN